jgi:hypothetical protein
MRRRAVKLRDITVRHLSGVFAGKFGTLRNCMERDLGIRSLTGP